MLKIAHIILLSVVSSLFLSGQQHSEMKTLLSEDARISAFGSLSAEICPFNGSYTSYVEGDGALVLNNFYLGGYGSRTVEFQSVYPDDEYYADKKLGQTQGGIFTGINFGTKRIIQYGVFMRIGWGHLSLRDNADKKILTRDRVNIFTPGFQAKLNITSFVQLCVGASYQLMPGIDLPRLKDEDFQGFCGSVSIRFGWF